MKLRTFSAIVAVVMQLGVCPLLGQPAISGFTPTFGAATDPQYITIHGSGFWPGSLVVKFNGVRDFTADVTTEQGQVVIKAQVPAAAPLGSGPIYVEVNGAFAWSAEDFTVIGPGPYVTGFSPSVGGPGASVTIRGAHFDTPLTVRFNGVIAQITTHNSYTNVVVNAPAGVTTGPISVTTSLGTWTTATNFHVPPVITGFSPTAGRTGTNVFITGTNFLGATAVHFNGVPATSFNVLSNRSMQVVVPTNATTGLIRVIAPAGSAFSSGNFVVQPTITGFAPPVGAVGTSVTVTGANFNVGTPVVRFGGGQAAAPTGVTFNQLTAVVPASATNGPITVTTADGTATSANFFYVPASIASFTPGGGPPGTIVRINGANFVGATNVSFNGLAAATFTVTNNGTIGAMVPVGVTTGPITVTTPAGTAASSGLFYGPPVISGFFPTRGLPGTNVLIAGVNFTGASAVRFHGSNAVFSVINNATISATVPANAQTGPITVVTPGGTNTTAETFTLDYTANLAVTVTDAPDPVPMTSNLTYTITVVNNGPFAMPGVMLTNTLPASVILKSAATSAGSLNTNGNPITASLGPLNVFSFATVTLVVAPQTPGQIVNVASVAGAHPDPVPGNNTAVTETFVEPLPLLSIRRAPPDRVRIAWPAALTNFTLEFNPLLVSTNVWSNVATLPEVIGGERVVTETNVGATKYYRLRR